MEWDMQFVAIIVTVLVAVGGACWTVMASVNKGLAETRKEAKEDVEKLRVEMMAGFAEAKEEREKGFTEAKDGRWQIRDDMNRRFDAVESRLARLEAPYFQGKSKDQGAPVGRVAEPRPAQYPIAGGPAGRPQSTHGREVERRDESGEGSTGS